MKVVGVRNIKSFAILIVTMGILASLFGLWVGAHNPSPPVAHTPRNSAESTLPAATEFKSELLHTSPVITF